MSNSLAEQYAAALSALTAIAMDAVAYQALTDTSLLDLTRLCSQAQRAAGSHSALIAAEVARRSAPELGHNGLAQSSGYRTPQELLRSTTGSTAREASSAINVGRLAHAAAGLGENLRPWLTEVGAAVVGDALSVAAAESIANGLGVPSEAVLSDELAAAAVQLCEEAHSLDADRLFRRARELRDELDEAGIALRETQRRDERSLKLWVRADGMGRLSWTMDPETTAVVKDLYDRATSPRRVEPTFIELGPADPTAPSADERLADDTRLPEQLASDVFVQLLRQGSDADSSQLLSTGAPSVRVLVTETALRTRSGHGRFEGQADPISIETVERLACEGSIVPISFDPSGQALDVGREQRLYTRRQRIALAARDGGCLWPGCERPPSWTEAHHTRHWQRDDGRTNVADGVLLCRHHHLLTHNDHWEIERDDGVYWLIPPTSNPNQERRAMPTKSRAMVDLLRQGSVRQGAVRASSVLPR